MVLLIVAASVVGAVALARTTAVSNRLNDHISPARTAVAKLETQGLARLEGDRLRVTGAGMLLLDAILAEIVT